MKDRIITFRYLFIFIGVVIVLLAVGSIYRIAHELNSSTFKNNSFSLLIVSKDSKLIYVDKNRRSALFVALGDIEEYVKGKNTLEATFSLGVPINAIIYDDKPPSNIEDFVSTGNEFRLFFDSKVEYKNLNKFDIFKLNSVLKSANKDNVKEVRIDLFNEEQLKSIESDFLDSMIRNSHMTIQIDNGTSINGLGNLLALILARQGYNVIAVRTSRPELSSYISYEKEGNATTNSLVGLTGFEYKMEKSSQASDVTIYLGEDVDAMLQP